MIHMKGAPNGVGNVMSYMVGVPHGVKFAMSHIMGTTLGARLATSPWWCQLKSRTCKKSPDVTNEVWFPIGLIMGATKEARTTWWVPLNEQDLPWTIMDATIGVWLAMSHTMGATNGVL